MSEPVCPYCGSLSKKVGGNIIYPHRTDLRLKTFYMCRPCGAWVGCHPGTDTPLGRLANAALRKAKSAAHAAFDPLWKAKVRKDGCKRHEARSAGYQWLAEQLNIDPSDCHIGMFDEDTCRRVVEICSRYRVSA